MPMFSLVTLGDLVVLGDGIPIGEARRKPLALLAYLAAEAPRAANRDLLAGLLWPESSPDRARRTLTQTLYALRREFHEELVVGTSQLSLGPTMAGSDVQDFLAAVAAANHAEALAAYKGPFLEGVSFAGAVMFEQWAEQWRARLAGLHRTSLLKETQRLRDCGMQSEAVVALERGLLWYPSDSDLVQRLVLLHEAGGAITAAIEALNRFERVLQREYELPLSPELVDLRRRLTRGTPHSGLAKAARFETPTMDAAVSAHVALHSTTFPGDASAPAPARTTKRRRRYLAFAAGISLLLAGAWRGVAELRPTDARAGSRVATLGELQKQYRERAIAERLATTDSAFMGRMLVLPATNASHDAALDTALQHLTYAPYSLEHSLLAKPVPESLTTRLLAEASATRLPTTTSQQIYAVMRKTGAALAVRPVLFRIGRDSLKVAFEVHRDITHTGAADHRCTPLESITGGGIGDTDVTAIRASIKARQLLFIFLKSLERCDLAEHDTPDKAPWCWSKGRVLELVPGLERWPIRPRRTMGAER